MLLLLGLFNPAVAGLRELQRASELDQIQKRLEVDRVSLPSLSAATRFLDAVLLKPVIAQRGAQLQHLARAPRLADGPHTLTLVDGTLLSALPQFTQAMLLEQPTGSGLVKWRSDTRFEVDPYVPTRIDVTTNGGGEHDERAAPERNREADWLYVMDRGWGKFSLFNRIKAKVSSDLCHLRDHLALEDQETRPLTDTDRAVGILSDAFRCRMRHRSSLPPSTATRLFRRVYQAGSTSSSPRPAASPPPAAPLIRSQ